MNKQIQNVVTEMIDGINYQQMIGGEIFLNLKDVAIGLGFERERERNGNITKQFDGTILRNICRK